MALDEQLDIDGINFNLAGFVLAPDLSPLLGHSAQRGGDRPIPGQPGGDPKRREIDITVVNIGLIIQGEITSAGVAHPDIRTGLYRNLKALQALSTPPATVAGTRTATLVWHAETPAPKAVHVLGDLQTAADGWDQIRAVMRLSFPDGLFEL
jgi:hypothetical protein